MGSSNQDSAGSPRSGRKSNRILVVDDNHAIHVAIKKILTDMAMENRSLDEMEQLTFDILKMGDYEANNSSFDRMITARQKEVLEAAVDLGYYSEPRQASLEDIGEVVGITPGTVSEHLRKAEERVFTELVH